MAWRLRRRRRRQEGGQEAMSHSAEGRTTAALVVVAVVGLWSGPCEPPPPLVPAPGSSLAASLPHRAGGGEATRPRHLPLPPLPAPRGTSGDGAQWRRRGRRTAAEGGERREEEEEEVEVLEGVGEVEEKEQGTSSVRREGGKGRVGGRKGV